MAPLEQHLRQCCDNPACQYYGKTGEDNIRTHSRQHQQVYCNACKDIWVITKGTFFYNLKAPVSLVLEVLRLLSEGMGLRAVCRIKEVTPDAVGTWLLKAAKHVQEVTIYLEREMHLTQCQIDEFWSYILLDSCVLAEEQCPSSRQDWLLLGEQIAKDIFHPLSELEVLVRIQD